MKRFKIGAVLLLVIICSASFAFAGGQQEETEGRLLIAAMNPFVSSPYQPAFIEWSENKAREMGAEVVLFDGEWDAQKMYDQVETIILQGFDGVNLQCLDAASGSKIVKKLNEAGIPVVTTVSPAGKDVDNLPYHIAYVGVDCYEEGLGNGKLVVDAAAGEDVNVVMIQGMMALEASVVRNNGFYDAIQGHDNIKLIAEQPADFDRAKSMAVMENFLASYPDIDFVYAHDDPMAVGALHAIKAAGKLDSIKVLGIGGSTEGCNAVKAGELYATINHPPEGEGMLSMEVLIRGIRGEKFEDWVKVPALPITAENVDEFDPKW